MLLSKELFLRAGGFCHDTPLYEDWEFNLRLAVLGVEWVPSGVVGTLYIRWGTGLSSATPDKHSNAKETILKNLAPELEKQLGEPISTSEIVQAHRVTEDADVSRSAGRLRFVASAPDMLKAFRYLQRP